MSLTELDLQSILAPTIINNPRTSDSLSLIDQAVNLKRQIEKDLIRKMEEKERAVMKEYEAVVERLRKVREEGRELRKVLGINPADHNAEKTLASQPFKTLVLIPALVPKPQWEVEEPDAPTTPAPRQAFQAGYQLSGRSRTQPIPESEVERKVQLSVAKSLWSSAIQLEQFARYKKNLLAFLSREISTIPFPVYDYDMPERAPLENTATRNLSIANQRRFVSATQDFVSGLTGDPDEYKTVAKMLGDWMAVWRIAKGDLLDRYRIALVVYALLELLVQDRFGFEKE